jgi:PhnB protein
VSTNFVPDGWPTLIPRIVAQEPEKLVAFIQHVFGATGEFQAERPTELRIGDSLLVTSGATPRSLMSAFLYVYVEDTDATHRRAIEAGATPSEDPVEAPYGDRRAMIEDPWGKIWQIATHGGAFTV